MAATLAELDTLLNDLQAKLPQMIEDYPSDEHFWAAFTGAAEAIEDKSNEYTYTHVMQRINAMLAEHRLYIVTGEFEGT